nr:transcription-repair coupling factor [Prevotella sp.]
MTISELLLSYGQSARAVALLKELEQDSPSSLSLYGLSGSSSAFLFASIVARLNRTLVFILDDNDEAGYFYNDVKQMLGDEKVFFLPSGYKRAVKYGQRDNAAGILRTEVLAKLSQKDSVHKDNIIVTYPQAVAELVVSQINLDNRLIRLKVGDTIDTSSLTKKLRDYGFTETDYVYEPGQFAMRGSI